MSRLLILCWLSLVVLLTGCQSGPTEGQTPAATPTAVREPIRNIWHISLVAQTAEELTDDSDLIVLGTVETIYPSRWTTEDGVLPPGAMANTIPSAWLIYTDVGVRVEESLKGGSEELVRVRLLGGTVGQDSMVADGEAELEPGRRYLLFLVHEDTETGQYGPPHYRVRALMQGAYEVVDDRAVSRVHEVALEELLAIIVENQ